MWPDTYLIATNAVRKFFFHQFLLLGFVRIGELLDVLVPLVENPVFAFVEPQFNE
jgi:hypothetical protein